ncbi:hypothetical protein F4781DRAFT_432178 [Annulohypoxylon bovei var. microspora]|nr:hypothetical protein F4781DRAFT_432178 [Annulohypoxylon bovei var. microspora]
MPHKRSQSARPDEASKRRKTVSIYSACSKLLPKGNLVKKPKIPSLTYAQKYLPATLAAHGLSKKDWEALEASQNELPRFLFRAFGAKSGGNARLNTKTGIIPRGFLGGEKPTHMYDIFNLRDMIASHLCGYHVNTHFSSWAACITIAMADGADMEYIGIIDRTLLDPHVKIYRVPDLAKAGLFGSSIFHSEYLAYGPISGPAFHCVAHSKITSRGYYSLAGRSFGVDSFDMSIYADMDKRVAAAKKLASLFRPSRDKRPDIIIALTAAFSTLSYCGFDTGEGNELNKKLLEKLIAHLHNELKAFKSSSEDYKNAALVNSNMYTAKYPQLQQLVLQLESIEAQSQKGDIFRFGMSRGHNRVDQTPFWINFYTKTARFDSSIIQDIMKLFI